MTNNFSVSNFYEGKAVDTETESVITFKMNDKAITFYDSNFECNQALEYDKLDLTNIDKYIELFYDGNKNRKIVLHFFTREESEIFVFAIITHRKHVNAKLNQIIIDTVISLSNQKVSYTNLASNFPFAKTNSLHEILSYFLFKYSEMFHNSDTKFIKEYIQDIMRKKKYAYYLLAGSFLSKYLDKFDDQTNVKILKENLSFLFIKWLNVAYAPSDFTLFYNRIQNLFSEKLSNFGEFDQFKLKYKKDIVDKFNGAYNGLKVDSFPLMSFACINYANENEIGKENCWVRSTYLYYIIKNSYYLYKKDIENNANKSQEIKQLRDCICFFIDFLNSSLEKTQDSQKLSLYFRRYQFLLFDVLNDDQKKNIIKRYNDILSKIKVKNQSLQRIKRTDFKKIIENVNTVNQSSKHILNIHD